MIKQATLKDRFILAEMAVQVWENSTAEELVEEFAGLISSEDSACFLKYTKGKAVGFAQCGLRRDYVEGTVSSPVGYLEGIYVEEAHRNNGYARALLAACETWAKDKGCTEFASDCILTNEESLRFHLAVGFLEANRIICFTKNLSK